MTAEMVRLFVLIPSNSGLISRHKIVGEPHSRGVLIPSNSGLISRLHTGILAGLTRA